MEYDATDAAHGQRRKGIRYVTYGVGADDEGPTRSKDGVCFVESSPDQVNRALNRAGPPAANDWPHPWDENHFHGGERLKANAIRAAEAVVDLGADVRERGAAAGGEIRARLVAKISSIHNSTGTRQLALWDETKTGYAAYKQGLLGMLIAMLEEMDPADVALPDVATCLAYAACDDLIQLQAVKLGVVPTLIKLFTSENMHHPKLLAAVADAMSSVLNTSEGCDEAIRIGGMNNVVDVLSSCVPAVEATAAAAALARKNKRHGALAECATAAEEPPVPDVDPHRVAFAAVEVVNSAAWDAKYRPFCVAAVPVLARVLHAGTAHLETETNAARSRDREVRARAWSREVMKSLNAKRGVEEAEGKVGEENKKAEKEPKRAWEKMKPGRKRDIVRVIHKKLSSADLKELTINKMLEHLRNTIREIDVTGFMDDEEDFVKHEVGQWLLNNFTGGDPREKDGRGSCIHPCRFDLTDDEDADVEDCCGTRHPLQIGHTMSTFQDRPASDFNAPPPTVEPKPDLRVTHPAVAPAKLHETLAMTAEAIGRVAFNCRAGWQACFDAGVHAPIVNILKKSAAPVMRAALRNDGAVFLNESAFDAERLQHAEDVDKLRHTVLPGARLMNMGVDGVDTVAGEAARAIAAMCSCEYDSVDGHHVSQRDLAKMRLRCIDAGVVPPLVALLRCGPWSRHAEGAAEALSWISEEHHDLRAERETPGCKAMFRAGAVPLLIELIRKGDPRFSECVTNAAQTLCNLVSCHKGAAHQCVAFNALPVLVSVLNYKPPKLPPIAPLDDEDAFLSRITAWTPDRDEESSPVSGRVVRAVLSARTCKKNTKRIVPNRKSSSNQKPPRDAKYQWTTPPHKPPHEAKYDYWVIAASHCLDAIRSIVHCGFGWAACIEAGALPALMQFLSNKDAQNAELATEILEEIAETAQSAVATSLWLDPHAFIGMLAHFDIMKNPLIEENEAPFIRRTIEAIFTAKPEFARSEQEVGVYEIALIQSRPETLARLLPFLLGGYDNGGIEEGKFKKQAARRIRHLTIRFEFLTLVRDRVMEVMRVMGGSTGHEYAKYCDAIDEIETTLERISYEAMRLAEHVGLTEKNKPFELSTMINFFGEEKKKYHPRRDRVHHPGLLVKLEHELGFCISQQIKVGDLRSKVVRTFEESFSLVSSLRNPTRSIRSADDRIWSGIALARLASEDGVSEVARYAPCVRMHPIGRRWGEGMEKTHLNVRWPTAAAALGLDDEDWEHQETVLENAARTIGGGDLVEGPGWVHGDTTTMPVCGVLNASSSVHVMVRRAWDHAAALAAAPFDRRNFTPDFDEVDACERDAAATDPTYSLHGEYGRTFVHDVAMPPSIGREAARATCALFHRLWNDSSVERRVTLEGRMREAWLDATTMPPQCTPENGMATVDTNVTTVTNAELRWTKLSGRKRKRGDTDQSSSREREERNKTRPRRRFKVKCWMAAKQQTVAEIKKDLKKYGKSTTGNKETLLARLHDAMKEDSEFRTTLMEDNADILLSKELDGEYIEEFLDVQIRRAMADEKKTDMLSPRPIFTRKDVNVNTNDGRTVSILVGGRPFYVHRSIIEKHSPFLTDVLRDMDAAAEASTFSSAARAKQLEPIPLPHAAGLPEDAKTLREIFGIAMIWLYTERRPNELVTVEDGLRHDGLELKYLPHLIALSHVLEAASLQSWCSARLAVYVAASCKGSLHNPRGRDLSDHSDESYDPVVYFPKHDASPKEPILPTPILPAPGRRCAAMFFAEHHDGGKLLNCVRDPEEDKIEDSSFEINKSLMFDYNVNGHVTGDKAYKMTYTALDIALEDACGVPSRALLAESPHLRAAVAFWAATRLGGAAATPAAVAPYRALLEGPMTTLLCGLDVGGPAGMGVHERVTQRVDVNIVESEQSTTGWITVPLQ